MSNDCIYRVRVHYGGHSKDDIINSVSYEKAVTDFDDACRDHPGATISIERREMLPWQAIVTSIVPVRG
jgi:hypothetical protein